MFLLATNTRIKPDVPVGAQVLDWFLKHYNIYPLSLFIAQEYTVKGNTT